MDKRWKELQQKLEQAMKKADYLQMSKSYEEMAKIVESEGEDSEYLMQKSREIKLRHENPTCPFSPDN